MGKEYNWLPELNGIVPIDAYGDEVSIYSIAYEAWRRGLDVKFENVYKKTKFKIRYTIYNKNNKVKFNHTRPNLVSKEAVKICNNKQITREILEKEAVPVPKGKVFKSLQIDSIKNNINDLTFPLVVKPLNGKGGKGVITGIENVGELIDSIKYLNKELKYTEFIVEEYIEGEKYRAFVIGDKVVGAYKRLPLHVIGDGKKTIRRLIKEKNNIRMKSPGTFNEKIIINKEVTNELKKKNYNLKSVPQKGESVRLQTENNASSKGDPMDATHELPKDFKRYLVKAIKAIPGLLQAGVDVIYDKKTGKYSILEINSNPSIRNHLYPIEGNAHEIPKAIIDYYFPETIDNYLNQTTPRYYFDFHFVKDYLLNNRLKMFTLPSHPYEPNLISKSIHFKSDRDMYKLRQMIENNFQKFNFNGELTLVGLNKYELLVAGNNQDIACFIDVLKSKKKITNIKIGDYDGPIRIGFTFNNKYEDLKTSSREIEKLRREIDVLLNSKSWKITAPLRKLMSKINQR